MEGIASTIAPSTMMDEFTWTPQNQRMKPQAFERG
jgi:hypothetical protein